MRSYPEDVKKMVEKFSPYLEWKDNGTYDFKRGIPLKIKQLRKKCFERVMQYQMEVMG